MRILVLMAALTAALAACSASQEEAALDESPEFQSQERVGASGNSGSFGGFGGLDPDEAGEELRDRQERDLQLREDGLVN